MARVVSRSRGSTARTSRTASRVCAGASFVSEKRRRMASTLRRRRRLTASRATMAPAPPTPATTAAAASTPNAAPWSKAVEIQAAASTAAQPAIRTPIPAIPKVTTRSRLRTGSAEMVARRALSGHDRSALVGRDHLRRRRSKRRRFLADLHLDDAGGQPHLIDAVDTLLIAVGLPAGIGAPDRD